MRLKLKPTLIDRYIIRKFIGTYFFAILLISLIVVIFDLSEKIDDFVETKAPLYDIVFGYYVNFIPFIANMFSPLFVFITVIFFTSKMAGHSEIIAILSGGVSFNRLMYPYFLSSLVIFIMSLILSLVVIPPANGQRLSFEERYLKKSVRNNDRNIHFQVEDNEFVYMESFATWDNSATRFALEKFDGLSLRSKLMAERAVFDTAANAWKLYNYTIRQLGDSGDVVSRGAQLDTVISITAADLRRYKEINEALTYKELNNTIAQLQARGDNSVKFALIEKYKRVTIPFSVFILTLMGVSLSSRKVRGGIGLKIGLGIGLSFTYILFLRFAEMFVYADVMPPFLALWTPNILYALIAVGLYIKAPK